MHHPVVAYGGIKDPIEREAMKSCNSDLCGKLQINSGK